MRIWRGQNSVFTTKSKLWESTGLHEIAISRPRAGGDPKRESGLSSFVFTLMALWLLSLSATLRDSSVLQLVSRHVSIDTNPRRKAFLWSNPDLRLTGQASHETKVAWRAILSALPASSIQPSIDDLQPAEATKDSTRHNHSLEHIYQPLAIQRYDIFSED